MSGQMSHLCYLKRILTRVHAQDELINMKREKLEYSSTTGPSQNFFSDIGTPCGTWHMPFSKNFRGRIEYELIYSLRGEKHRVDYSVHIR